MIIHLKASETQLRLVIPLEGWPGGRRNHVFCAQWASKDTSDVTTKVKERGNGCTGRGAESVTRLSECVYTPIKRRHRTSKYQEATQMVQGL